MEADLEKLGYVLEYGRVDTQDFLLPQRRNRIYATADVSNGQCPKQYAEAMASTMAAFQSDLHVDLEFDRSLPKESLTTDRQQTKLKEALEAAVLKEQTDDVFIDGSTSNSRPSEYAINVLTCVRPSHQIYSQQLQRWITPTEMWHAQGLFPVNFPNPDAVEELFDNPSLTQSLAGNAFSATVVQAKLLASMIHSQGWDSIVEDSSALQVVDTMEDGSSQASKSIRSLSSSDSLVPAGCLLHDPKNDSSDAVLQHIGQYVDSSHLPETNHGCIYYIYIHPKHRYNYIYIYMEC